MSKSQIVGGRVFQSIAAVQAYLDEILRAHVEEHLPEVERRFVLDLARQKHPHPELFRDVDGVRVALSRHGNPLLEFKLARGLVFRPRLSRLWSDAPRERVSNALRQTVVDQIEGLRAAAFASGDVVVCPVTNYPTRREDSHVDHAPPWVFARIVDGWLARVARATYSAPREVLDKISRSLVPHAVHDVSVLPVASLKLGHLFAAYHAERAKLRVVHAFANTVVLPALQRAETRSDAE